MKYSERGEEEEEEDGVDEARGTRGGKKWDAEGGKRFLISACCRREKSGERAEGKTNTERFLRSFVWVVDVVIVVIGDASPTNLIRTDTSECAHSVEEGKEERSVFVQ